MAQRQVSILDKAAQEVAYVTYYIESKGLPETAKKFIDDSLRFFETLGDDRIKYKPYANRCFGESKVTDAPDSEKNSLSPL